MSCFVFVRSTFERGPRLDADDSPLTPVAVSGLSPPETSVLGLAAYGPVSVGRPWKTQLPTRWPGHLTFDQFWPIRVEPLAVMDPSAWCLNRSCATPVPTKAYTKPKNTR